MFDSLEFSALLISAIAGILIGIPTGPAGFFVVDTCIKDGKKKALRVYGGVITAKLIYASLALLLNELILRKSKIETIIYLVASFLLIIWGIFIMIKSRKKSKNAIQLNVESNFKKGFIVGITNPAIPFIYLTLVQIITAYSKNVSTFDYIIDILTFETVTFITLTLISLLLLTKKDKVLNHWNKVKFIMGVIIAGVGVYQVVQMVEFAHGIKIKKKENVLEQQLGNGDGKTKTRPYPGLRSMYWDVDAALFAHRGK